MIYKEPKKFTIPTTKKCSKCGIEKPLTEYYSNKTSKDKTISRCKTCIRADQNIYSHSEKGKAYQKAYKQSKKYKDKRKVYNKTYNESEKGKAFYHSEKRKAYNKAHNRANYLRRKGELTNKELDAA